MDYKMNLSEACERFLTHCATEKNLSALTIRAYRGDLTCFAFAIGDQRCVSEFSEAWIETTVQRWSGDPTLKISTIKRRAACIKVFVRWLFRRRMIAFNPLERIQLEIRIPKRLPRNLQTEEIRKLVANKPEGMLLAEEKTVRAQRKEWEKFTARLAIEVLFLTGVRVGELVKIARCDIDYSLRQIRVFGKGSRERHVSFPDAITTDRLKVYCTESVARFGKAEPDMLFINGLGRPADAQYIRRIIRAFAENASLTPTAPS
jgi:site-specific recombinase XerD